MKRLALLVVAGLLVACSSNDEQGGDFDTDFGDPGDCTVIDAAISPEKIDLVSDLARTFNASEDSQDGDRCWFVQPYRKSSGAGARALYEGWDEQADGPFPVIWSPAASTWGQVVNRRLDPATAPLAIEEIGS